MARVDQSPEPDAPVAWSPYGTTRSDASLPTVAPGYPWLYAHYPQNWAVDLESGEILPDLTIVPGMPGVADTGREVPGGLGGGDMSGAVLSMSKRGAKVFDRPNAIPGLDAPYVRPVKVRGGYAFLDYACEAIASSPAVRIDPAKRLQMLRAFRALVDPIAPHVIEAQIERAERDHANATMKADNPLHAREAARYAREIEIWRAALEGPVSDPTPTTRRRKAAAED
jgi:hypothetical protein